MGILFPVEARYIRRKTKWPEPLATRPSAAWCASTTILAWREGMFFYAPKGDIHGPFQVTEDEDCIFFVTPKKGVPAPLSQGWERGWGRGPVVRHPTNNSLFYHELTNHPRAYQSPGIETCGRVFVFPPPEVFVANAAVIVFVDMDHMLEAWREEL
jgi:hypothetical protein